VQFGFWLAIALTLFVAFAVLPLDYAYTRHLHGNETSLVQSGDLEVKGDALEVFEKSLAVLAHLKIVREVAPDRDRLAVKAKTRLSWKSFGEEITLYFEPSAKGRVRISVTSQPLFERTLVDYGKNRENLRLVCDALRHAFGEQ
jgi:hypothetical protein